MTDVVLERGQSTETAEDLVAIEAYVEGALLYWKDHAKQVPLDELQQGVECGLNASKRKIAVYGPISAEATAEHFRQVIRGWEDLRENDEWTDFERGHVIGLTMVLKHMERSDK